MLRKTPFSDELLERVADFHCGDEAYHLEVSDWIKASRGAGGALDHLDAGKCCVWLYLDGDEVAGFGSLGPNNWKYPTSKDKRRPVNIIPNVAIATEFQGKGLFKEVLGHLFYEAKQCVEREPAVGLFVHPDNRRAIDTYLRYGFEHFHHEYRDPATGVVYRSLIYRLPE